MKDKLTDIAIRAMKPRPQSYRVSDGGGLYLQIETSGSKLWRYAYRFGGKQKTLAIGAYPDVSLADARARHLEARRLLSEGVDPGQVRQQAKRDQKVADANSFEAVAREYAEKRKSSWSARHHKEFIARLADNIFPELGERPIAEIQAPDLLAVLRKVESRGALDAAKRLRSVCSLIFRYGVATGRCKADVARDLVGALEPPTPSRMAAVRPEELPALVQAIVGYTGSPVVRLGLQLLMLTAVRPGELVAARWEEFDEENRVWIVPAMRMKRKKADKAKIEGEHLVPLSPWAMEVLEELKQYSVDGEYLFPHERHAVGHMRTDALLYGLYAMGYQGTQTGHGFRAIFSTILNEHRGLGLHKFPSAVIEKQLAHVEGTTVSRAYNRAQYLTERQDLMDYWADYLTGLRNDKQVPPTAKAEPKVIALTSRARSRRGLGASLMCFAL
jgi:integrase